MARLDELKREVAELEAKTQQPTEEQPTTQTPEEKADADRLMIRRIFAKMLCYCDDRTICKFHLDNWHLGA
jgi:hypothetical protein